MLSMAVPSGEVGVVSKVPPPPVAFPDPAKIKEAALILSQAKRPLVIVGKGEFWLGNFFSFLYLISNFYY